MRSRIILLAFFGYSTLFIAQSEKDYNGSVGINTETPKATLEVKGSPHHLNRADGIIAPRLTRAELIAKQEAYGIEELGAIIYITEVKESDLEDNNQDFAKIIPNIGYYYWDGAKWKAFMSESAIREGSEKNNLNYWNLGGNNIGETNFIGSLNDQNVSFKRNSKDAGYIGAYSTAFGVGSLPNPNLLLNDAFGIDVLSQLSSGSSNTGVGFGVMRRLINGEHNVGIGASVLSNIRDSSFNTAIGSLSFYLTSEGTRNTGVGHSTFYQNVRGSGNVGLGHKAGFYSKGSNNIAIGYNTENFSDNQGHFQLNIGNAIYGLNMSTLFGNKQDVKIGIGITSPKETLEVNGNIKIHSTGEIIESGDSCNRVGTITYSNDNFFGCVGIGVWKPLTL